ncbi:o-succinylbenzoate--CoA ligase [Thermincola ferriacetica]|uniref:O-succinylbenzoate--CoA ligase n=1 Tax=Thermincola ferriacetica TaxID=281456 RepID=A0A0L6W347_9FIRM|nr:long-chain fatty acid--CoA ligase [Thermincola ferriacetica]KNZ69992.1 o-succinylbenzoate--CoA ligase [Thermincola ferriacetica]
MTLGEMITAGAKEFADRPALKFKGRTWPYKELDEQANKVANGLKRLGIGKGDRVGLLMLNSSYFVISYFAIVKLGAIVVPVNVMFKAEELIYQLNDAGVSALITAPLFMPLVTLAQPQIVSLKYIVVQDLEQDYSAVGTVSMQSMLKNESGSLDLDYAVSSDDVAVLLYTSGTTGNPKGAMITHHNMLANAAATKEATASGYPDSTVCVLPMFHSFAWTACVLLPLTYGGLVIILESFSPQTSLRTIVEEKATIFAGVPTMYSVLLQVPNVNPADFAHLRLAYSGGAACPVELSRKFKEKFGIQIFEGYGLSECSPVCTTNPYYGERKPGSIGVPIPGVEVKIVDEKGNEVPRNTPGELCFKGPNVMKGYWNRPEATAEALKDGWMHSGDIGYMDEEGYIFIMDRKKDLVIVGGLNVYPREIEEVLYTNPKVAEAAVVGVADDLRGEIVKAFVVLKEGETATERELIKYCQERLANYKLPKVVEFRDALPKNSTGKILKRELV